MPYFEAAASFLMPQDCLLCLGAGGARLVCPACEAALPAIEHSCTRCALPLPMRGICGECLSRPFAFDDASACFVYAYPLDRLVHRFKYAGDLGIGRWLALRLADRVAGMRPDVVVAPPLTRARLRQRGFNQALEVAKVVARRVRAKCEISTLARTRETSPQPGLDRRERQANLREAFRGARDFDGLHVAIVDDVMTTGATMDAIAAVLRRRGATRVSAWCIARAVL
jgi:ComF family protein